VYSSTVEHWTFNPQVLGSNPSIPIHANRYMLTINITYVLILTCIVFFIGLLGIILNRKNILAIIMSVELLLLAVNLNFAVFSIYLDDIVGQIFVLFVLTIAATESAIGLAIITVFYRLKSSIELKPIKRRVNKI
jgi:NADH-quinone oxidoreductase subunit K